MENNEEKSTLPISIVIPTLNEEKYLPILLKSIRNQQYQPHEIIVADSPKTIDGTKEIAKSFGAKVVEGGFIAVGRNNGGRTATGDIILFLDADATLPNNYFLMELYVLFMKHKLDIGSCFLDLDTTEKMKFVDSIGPNLAFQTWNQLKKLNGVTKKVISDSGTGIVVRKEVFDALGGFREDKEFIGEDTEFPKRAVESGYKYKVLPVRIISSGRRYNTPKKAGSALLSIFLTMAVVSLGLYNSDSIIKAALKLYGQMGGEVEAPKKKSSQK